MFAYQFNYILHPYTFLKIQLIAVILCIPLKMIWAEKEHPFNVFKAFISRVERLLVFPLSSQRSSFLFKEWQSPSMRMEKNEGAVH